MRCLAAELSPRGIQVNCVCPGFVNTPFNDPFWNSVEDRDAALRNVLSRIPIGRQADPDDLAGLLLFLASPESAYITGQALVIDGGYLAV